MGVGDSVNYVLFENPVSATIISTVKSAANATVFKGSTPPTLTAPPAPKLPPALEKLDVSRLVSSGSPIIRLAGLSGATAVILGAYGAHSLYPKDGSEELEERKRIYETANRYHFLHTLALFGVPLSRHPKATGSFLSIGMLLFCGTCYYDAFTGKTDLRKLTPIGGTFLIIGWLFMVL